MDTRDHLKNLVTKGYSVCEGFLSDSLVVGLKTDCERWIKICGEYQKNAGLVEDYTGHHCVGDSDGIDELLHSHRFHPLLAAFFEKKNYILHACNPVLGPPSANSYLHKIHRDINTFIPDANLRMNVLVALDDFTIDNGATEILPYSHRTEAVPSTEEFDSKKVSLCMPKGSVAFFNSYLWHRAGKNATQNNRVALTLSYGLSFIKPQLDYERLLGEDTGRSFSPLSRQIFGYNSRVPVSLIEWYQKPDDRLYHADQG